MFAYLQGRFKLKTPTEINLDIQGAGYKIFISLYTFSKIQTLSEGMLYIHNHIREDTYDLYGFYDLEEKNLFTELIKISGISVNTARIMLSSLSPQEMLQVITQGNNKSLETIKGIGKKTAERIILELKDTLHKKYLKDPVSTAANNTLSALETTPTNILQDTIQALVALGIHKQQASIAAQKANNILKDNPNLEQLIKTALQFL